MKILIVDDNQKRRLEISKIICSGCPVAEEQLTMADTTNKAKRYLKSVYFDILILDVILPRRDDDRPLALNGLSLLHEIGERPTIRKPGTIIGITSNSSDFGEYQKEFSSYCFQVIEAGIINTSWKNNIVSAVNYAASACVSKISTDKQKVCITVHGIQSFGDWQLKLKQRVELHTTDVRFYSFKYGFLDIISFVLPKKRQKLIEKFANCIVETIELNKSCELYIFSHSYGTFITVNALRLLAKQAINFEVKKLVLAGSVLNVEHDFSDLHPKIVHNIVNECGINDLPLLASEIAIKGMGMAGRVGFNSMLSNSFLNRYHKGGHGTFFESKFMDKYWVPLFSNDFEITEVDNRKINPFKIYLVEKTSRMLGKIKPYGIPILMLISFVLVSL